LLVTSRQAGLDSPDILLSPQQQFSRANTATRILAVQVQPKTGGRLVVVGNGEFASDRFAQNSPENLNFALNAVDWLAQDEALISIRSKDRAAPPPAVSEPAHRGL